MQGKIGLEAYVKKVDEETNAKIHIETTGKIESGSGDVDVEIKPEIKKIFQMLKEHLRSLLKEENQLRYLCQLKIKT